MAERYDLSFGPFGEQDPEMGEFFRKLFIRHSVYAILDCACGTGRHLPMFRGLGCEVWGADISEAMLRQAGEHLSGQGLEIPITQADFRELPGRFDRQFDAVVCLGAIGFMPGKAEFIKAFRSMAGVLRPGGILVLTALPTDRQWKEKKRFFLMGNNRDFSRLFAIDYFADRVCFNVLDIFHSDEASGLKVWSADIYPLLRDDQEALLKAAGFQAVDFYGGFNFTPYDKETSGSLITVAHK
jgi:ubiquinone/menaquinone biosynthesis C-methylase UbiE